VSWLCLVLSVLAACENEIDLGDDCTEEGCTCGAAQQDVEYLLPECDGTVKSCSDYPIPYDDKACMDCMAFNRDVGLDNDNPLLQCVCRHCAAPLRACRESPDSLSNQYCQSQLNCALRNDCVGLECYCGPGVDLEQCRQLDVGLGPCAALTASVREVVGCNPGERLAECVIRVHESPDDNPFRRAFLVTQCVGDPLYNAAAGNCRRESGMDAAGP
jgi:hypothetical protein